MASVYLWILLSCLLCPIEKQPATSARKVTYQGHSYSVFTVDPGRADIQLFTKRDTGVYDFNTVQQYYADHGDSMIFAMNGGMYMADRRPLGLCVVDGQTLRKLNTSQGNGHSGNFYDLPPNGVFALDEKRKAYVVRTNQYEQLTETTQVMTATQSGPMLVYDNTINTGFGVNSKNLNIRNGVGVNALGQVVFVISDEAVNFYDLATLFRDSLQCSNALYLDGYVSRMYLPQLGHNMLNHTDHLGPIIAIGIPKP